MIAMKKAKTVTFAAKLQQLIEAQGPDFTAYRLAKDSGVPKQTISRYLRGERQPALEEVLRIARALGVSLAAFDDVTFSPMKG